MNVIDLEKLENLVLTSSGFQSACPACLFNGEDSHSRNHLGIQRDGKFNCVKYGKDTEHNSLILKLVGTESTGETVYAAPVPKIDQEKSWPLDILAKLYLDYSYFEGRGISIETQKFFKLGVALSGQLNKRVCIPIPNKENTKIIGFTGRLIEYTDWHKENGIGKYKHLGKVSNFLWPYFPQEIIKSKKILLVESPACVLYLWDRGIKNVICLFGVTASSKIIAYLISLGIEEILIGLNNELESDNKGVGNKKAIKIRSQLLQFFSEERVKVALPPIKDFSSLFGHKQEIELLDKYKASWLN